MSWTKNKIHSVLTADNFSDNSSERCKTFTMQATKSQAVLFKEDKQLLGDSSWYP